jgi:hypothetical protein
MKFMFRKIFILTLLFANIVYSNAQEIKFGVHVDPAISFLDSDYSKVSADGVNFSFALGVEVEYRFSDNAAFTFGVDFSLNNGGSILYGYSGVLFANSEFDNAKSFFNMVNVNPSSSTGIDMYAFTKVNYRINYVEVPLGFKFRTEELGGSYMRVFFHLPIVKIMIPVMASAKIFAPQAAANGFEDDINSSKYGVPQASSANSVDDLGYVVENNVWKDITPIQVSVGAGAGVEFSPTDPDGLRLYAGIYYHSGLLDVTGGFLGKTTYTEALTLTNLLPDSQERNPRNAMHTIALRIGAIF